VSVTAVLCDVDAERAAVDARFRDLEPGPGSRNATVDTTAPT
jgi:hypothetical protein